MQHRGLLSVLLMAALLLGNLPARAEDYKLGPQDKVRVRVEERRAATSDVFEWAPLSGEYRIGASGEISLPLIGSLKAGGLTPDQLSDAIIGQIRERTGLTVTPIVALEIIQYRPFYIVGAVEKAGEYDFRPGLTVLQAVAIAGGVRRSLATGQELLVQKGEAAQLKQQYDSIRIRNARLEAERKGAETLTLPPDLEKRKNEGPVKRIVEQETAIMQARRQALNSEVGALTGLKDFLTKEVSSIQEQIKQHDKEMSMVREESANIDSLAAKGLVVSGTKLSMKRTAIQLEAESFRLETSLLKAKQESARADISILEARNKWATDVATLLRDTESKLGETELRLKIARNILYQAGEGIGLAVDAKRASPINPKYTLIRQIDGKTDEFEVSEAGSVMPGDSIKVELPLAQDSAVEGVSD